MDQIDVLLQFHFYFHEQLDKVNTKLVLLIFGTARSLHHCANEYIFPNTEFLEIPVVIKPCSITWNDNMPRLFR